MNELMASALSPAEIAQEFLYHDDPGVKKLALAVADDLVNGEDVADLESDLDAAQDAKQEAEQEVEDLKDLLGECLNEVKDADLLARIKKAL